MRLTIRSAALSAVVVLGAAWAAQAQPSAENDHRGAHPMAAQMQAMREAHERQRAQDLRTILRLRPDQEPALAAFLQSHKPPMTPPERHGPPGEGAAMTTLQRLDGMARHEAEQTAARQRQAEALRAFYAALGPEQRQVFDALQRMQHGGHEHGDWGHHGFGGGRGPMGGPPPGGPPPRD
jgi:hypothetical protein